MNIIFHKRAWEDYIYWQATDKNILKKLNELIKECTRTPFEGKGNPEALKNNLAGFWSRRIDKEHRLVYTIENSDLYIIQCRLNY